MSEVPEYFRDQKDNISERSCYKKNYIPLFAIT